MTIDLLTSVPFLVTVLTLAAFGLGAVCACWKLERSRNELNAKHFPATERHRQEQLRKNAERLLANCELYHPPLPEGYQPRGSKKVPYLRHERGITHVRFDR